MFSPKPLSMAATIAFCAAGCLLATATETAHAAPTLADQNSAEAASPIVSVEPGGPGRALLTIAGEPRSVIRVTDGDDKILAIRMLGASGVAQVPAPIDAGRFNALGVKVTSGDDATGGSVSYVAPPTSVSLLAAKGGLATIDVVGSYGENGALTIVRDEKGDVVLRKGPSSSGAILTLPVDPSVSHRYSVTQQFSGIFESAPVTLDVPAGDVAPMTPKGTVLAASATSPRIEVEGLPDARVELRDDDGELIASGTVRRAALSNSTRDTWVGTVDISKMTGRTLHITQRFGDAVSPVDDLVVTP